MNANGQQQDLDPGRVFLAALALVRAIPNALPGKLRLARLLTRWLPRGRAVRIPDGLGNMISCPSIAEPIALTLFANGSYEPETISTALRFLPTGGVYVDVGANIGALALQIATLRTQAQVICIEADPDIAATLRRNLAENGKSNATVIECLAGASTLPEVAFYRAPQQSFGMGSIGPQFGAPAMRLQQRSLDDLLDEIGVAHVHVVKLDIEGAELGALQGMTRRLTGPAPPVLIFEFVDWAEARIEGQRPGDAQGFLLSLGYRIFVLGKKPGADKALSQPLTIGASMMLGLPSTMHGDTR